MKHGDFCKVVKNRMLTNSKRKALAPWSSSYFAMVSMKKRKLVKLIANADSEEHTELLFIILW